MLHIHTLAHAKKIARSLEKALSRKGLALTHGAALDALAAMAGFADWNSFDAATTEEGINEQLHDFEISHLENSGDDLDYGQESALVAHTGFQLRFSATELCDYVRVCDPLGRELMYWHEDEWREDPAIVMGAILGALVRGKPVEVKRERKARVNSSLARAVRRAPTILDVNFFEVHSVIFGGSCYNLEWREEAALAYLGRQSAEDYDNWEDSTALSLHREEDGLVWQEDLTVGQLNDLVWDNVARCFKDKDGETYSFYLSSSFADSFEASPASRQPAKPVVVAKVEALDAAPANDGTAASSPVAANVETAGTAMALEAPYQLFRVSDETQHTLIAARTSQAALDSAVKQGRVSSETAPTCEAMDPDLFGPYLVHVNAGFYNEFESLTKAIKVAQGLLDADEDLDSADVMTTQGTVLISFEA